MRFRKYHGAGNDFVMLADLEGRLGPPGSLDARLVTALCDRHKGVGADGVIRIMTSPVREGALGGSGHAAGEAGDGDGHSEQSERRAPRQMDYYNADGGAAEMCGNGIRCLVAHEQRAGRLDRGEHQVVTLAGPVTVRSADKDRLAVDMGPPGPAHLVEVVQDGRPLAGTTVSMGNPHLVLFADEIGRSLDDETVLGLGPLLERHADFPQRTNVEFVEVADATRIRMRVWERGIGETMACGSGACAVTVAAASRERTGPHVIVEVPGGELEVEWEPGGSVWLTGPAEEVFAGEIDARWLAARGLEAAVLEGAQP